MSDFVYRKWAAEKKIEKQRLLEDGDSVRHLDTDGSFDCYEHNFVHGTGSYIVRHGTRSYQYVKNIAQ